MYVTCVQYLHCIVWEGSLFSFKSIHFFFFFFLLTLPQTSPNTCFENVLQNVHTKPDLNVREWPESQTFSQTLWILKHLHSTFVMYNFSVKTQCCFLSAQFQLMLNRFLSIRADEKMPCGGATSGPCLQSQHSAEAHFPELYSLNTTLSTERNSSQVNACAGCKWRLRRDYIRLGLWVGSVYVQGE